MLKFEIPLAAWAGKLVRTAWPLAHGTAWLCVLLSGLQLCLPPLRAAQTNAAIAAAQPPAAMEQDLANLIKLDDLAHEEIEQWLEEAATNRLARDGVYQAALNLKIKQRREVVAVAYEDFLGKHPEHVQARILFGSFLREFGRGPEALEQWQEAARLAPANAAVWNNLGNYYGEEGPYTNAFASYNKAVELAPKEPLYHQNLARNLLLHDEAAAEFYRLKPPEVLAKAQSHYRKVIELSPTNFAAATELAQTYYAVKLPLTGQRQADWAAAQKLSDEALTAWRAALKLAPGEKERQGVQLHLARIQISAERWSDARKSLNQVTDPTLAGLKAELEVKLETRKDKPGNARGK